ncbi:MAG: sulfatase-like hydrolase/transferase [Candidatus Lokiarchaeota archaeon]
MESRKSHKAVFLITIDAFRKDHIQSYGYHINTMPNLEKIIKSSSKFLNAFTNGPETPSAFSSLFTSTLPFLDGGFSPLPKK